MNATVYDLVVPLLREKLTLNLFQGATLTVGVEAAPNSSCTFGTRDLQAEIHPLVFPECPEALAAGMTPEEMNCTNQTVNPYDFPYTREISPAPYNADPPFVTGQTHES